MGIDLDLAAFWLECVATIAVALGAMWVGVLAARSWGRAPVARIHRPRRWEEIPEADEGEAPALPRRPRRPREEYLVRRECPCGYSRRDASRAPAAGGGHCPECREWTLETRTICRVRWPKEVKWRDPP